jgi:hypothetical protein
MAVLKAALLPIGMTRTWLVNLRRTMTLKPTALVRVGPGVPVQEAPMALADIMALMTQFPDDGDPSLKEDQIAWGDEDPGFLI